MFWRVCSCRMTAAGESIEDDDDAYCYEHDILRMHVLFEAYLLYEQVSPKHAVRIYLAQTCRGLAPTHTYAVFDRWLHALTVEPVTFVFCGWVLVGMVYLGVAGDGVVLYQYTSV